MIQYFLIKEKLILVPVKIKIIKTENIFAISKLLSKVITKTQINLLKEPFAEMASLPYFEWVGLFVNDQLAIISSL